MQEVYRRIAAAAGTDMGVPITGPSGSGKELVARTPSHYRAATGRLLPSTVAHYQTIWSRASYLVTRLAHSPMPKSKNRPRRGRRWRNLAAR